MKLCCVVGGCKMVGQMSFAVYVDLVTMLFVFTF